MNEKEKIQSYIAMCKCCLLAQAMKECAMCRFNIGLAEEIKLEHFITLPISGKPAIFTMAEQC